MYKRQTQLQFNDIQLTGNKKEGRPHASLHAAYSKYPVSYTHLDVYKRQVDMNGESAQIAHLDALSCQKLLPHAVHRLDQDLSLIHIYRFRYTFEEALADWYKDNGNLYLR